MKKHILLLSTLLCICGQLYARKGVKAVNETKTSIEAMIQKGKIGWTTIDAGKSKFLESTTGGNRAISWKQEDYTYQTPPYSSPDTIFIKDQGKFDIKTGGFLGKTEKNLKAAVIGEKSGDKTVPVKPQEPPKKEQPPKKPSKIEQITKLPKSVLSAAKKIYDILDTLEIVTEQLFKETQRIKAKAKLIGLQKTIGQKVGLVTDIMGQNIRPLVISGVYPLMDSLVKMLDIVGKDIVGVFDEKVGKSIMDAAKTIKNLRTKSETSKTKTIMEYLDVIEKVSTELTKFLKNTQWIKN